MSRSTKVSEFMLNRREKKAIGYRDRLLEIKNGVDTFATEDNIKSLEEMALEIYKYTANPDLVKTLNDSEALTGLKIGFAEDMEKLFAAQKEACCVYWDFLQVGGTTNTVLIKQVHDLNQEITTQHISYHARITAAQTTGKKLETPAIPTTPEGGKNTK